MHIQKGVEVHSFVIKIPSKNKILILTSFKGYNSEKFAKKNLHTLWQPCFLTHPYKLDNFGRGTICAVVFDKETNKCFPFGCYGNQNSAWSKNL